MIFFEMSELAITQFLLCGFGLHLAIGGDLFEKVNPVLFSMRSPS